MADINVTVTGTATETGKGAGSYSGDSDAAGKIEVEPEGNTEITFTRGAGQTWKFQSPWITFAPASTSFTVHNCTDTQVKVTDNDPATVHAAASYEYTLCTDSGKFDPTILNKGKR